MFMWLVTLWEGPKYGHGNFCDQEPNGDDKKKWGTTKATRYKDKEHYIVN